MNAVRPRRFDLIVFDWDGTLMDSTAHIARSIQAACRDLGLPVPANEAARFVTLIDALYEHRVKLLAAADAEPAGLYPAGDGSFEFARTVSRLEEMRSAEYLAAGHGAVPA